MGLAKNFMGMEAGGGIPHNPELAGAPYKMRGVRLMKAGGINEYGAGGSIYADNGVQTPPKSLYSGSSFAFASPEEQELKDRGYTDEQILQRKVDMGQASKTERDNDPRTIDFNVIPPSQFQDSIEKQMSKDIKGSDLGSLIREDKPFAKLRGEFVEYDDARDRDLRDDILTSEYAGEDSGFVNPVEANYEIYKQGQKSAQRQLGELVDKTGMGDTGFTLEEFGRGMPSGTYGFSEEERGRRAISNLKDNLRSASSRFGDAYEKRADSRAARAAGKQFAGGRVRTIRRRR